MLQFTHAFTGWSLNAFTSKTLVLMIFHIVRVDIVLSPPSSSSLLSILQKRLILLVCLHRLFESQFRILCYLNLYALLFGSIFNDLRYDSVFLNEFAFDELFAKGTLVSALQQTIQTLQTTMMLCLANVHGYSIIKVVISKADCTLAFFLQR